MRQLPMSANLKNNKGDQQSRNERHTFVLVHGGWCGGWLWRYVAPALRERGHVVTKPTLTGLGERRHSENRTATLSTHIEDIVAHIEMEGFQDVTLVSQSYGGMVATGTLARIPDSIRSMIYLDAFIPEDGKSLIDSCSPIRASLEQMAALVGSTQPRSVRAAISKRHVGLHHACWIEHSAGGACPRRAASGYPSHQRSTRRCCENRRQENQTLLAGTKMSCYGPLGQTGFGYLAYHSA